MHCLIDFKSISFPYRITGDPQKVDYAKQLVYELIAEKEMQMFHRSGRGTDRTGNYANESGFNHGPANTDGVEVVKLLFMRKYQ